jgi:hypothetical protein
MPAHFEPAPDVSAQADKSGAVAAQSTRAWPAGKAIAAMSSRPRQVQGSIGAASPSQAIARVPTSP